MGFMKTLLGLLLVLMVSIASWANEPPNIVLILTDDQPYGYLGITGNPIVETPNIDELAQQGTLFTNAHVSSAICTPSRVSILLGQYERRHGVNFNSGTAVSETAWQQSYPELMKQAGYYTGWIGKNHSPVGSEGYKSGIMEESFDYWFAGHGHIRFYPKDKYPVFSEASADTQVEIMSEGVNDFLDSNEHRFKKAVSFLNERPKNKPFLLSLNFNLPHAAGTDAMKMRTDDDDLYKTKYRDIKVPLPKHYIAKKDIKKPKLPTNLLKVKDRQQGYNSTDTPQGTVEQLTRQMQAMTGIDRLVGTMRKKLEQEGLADNTVIIFTSDHGLFMGEHGLGGKALCYEKTTHVPLIVFDPRNNKQVKTSNALVQSIDIAPTILAMAGVKVPDTMQGEDIQATWLDGTQANRAYTFTENLWSTHFGNPRCEAIQDHTWKYIRYYRNDNMSAQFKQNVANQLKIPFSNMMYAVHDNDVAVYRHYVESSINGEPAVYEELYHLKSDPDELVNLAYDPQYRNKLKQLRHDWYPILINARGSEDPAVVRYTIDLQLEKGKGVQFE